MYREEQCLIIMVILDFLFLLMTYYFKGLKRKCSSHYQIRHFSYLSRAFYTYVLDSFSLMRNTNTLPLVIPPPYFPPVFLSILPITFCKLHHPFIKAHHVSLFLQLFRFSKRRSYRNL